MTMSHITKDDLREVKDDLRREFHAELSGMQAAIGGLEKTLLAKIEGIDRGLWIKLMVAVVANIGVVVGIIYGRPQVTHAAGALMKFFGL